MIGFPSLASTSAEQGRLAACDAFGVEAHPMDELLPFGVYAIPEIGFVGKTETELTAAAFRTRSASPTTASSRAARSTGSNTAC